MISEAHGAPDSVVSHSCCDIDCSSQKALCGLAKPPLHVFSDIMHRVDDGTRAAVQTGYKEERADLDAKLQPLDMRLPGDPLHAAPHSTRGLDREGGPGSVHTSGSDFGVAAPLLPLSPDVHNRRIFHLLLFRSSVQPLRLRSCVKLWYRGTSVCDGSHRVLARKASSDQRAVVIDLWPRVLRCLRIRCPGQIPIPRLQVWIHARS